MSIVYHLLFRQYGDKDYQHKADLLLEEVGVQIGDVAELSFVDGLAGIGWAVEWLVQNDLLEDTNTDEVLEDLDDILYKSIVFQDEPRLSLANGILGKMAYFIKRFNSINPGIHRFKRIALQEGVVLLLDRLGTHLKAEGHLLNRAAEGPWSLSDLLDLGDLLLIVSSAGTSFKANLTEPILYEAAELSHLLLKAAAARSQELTEEDTEYLIYLLFLAGRYFVAGKLHQHRYWREKAADFALRLEKAVSVRISLLDRRLALKALTVYTLLQTNQPKEAYAATMKALIQRLASGEIEAGLVEGWGSIQLAKLCLENPELISSWDELLLLTGGAKKSPATAGFE